jgi:hypothetical protein
MFGDLILEAILLLGIFSGALIAIVLIVSFARKSRKGIIICLIAMIFPLACISWYLYSVHRFPPS